MLHNYDKKIIFLIKMYSIVKETNKTKNEHWKDASFNPICVNENKNIFI